MATWLQETT